MYTLEKEKEKERADKEKEKERADKEKERADKERAEKERVEKEKLVAALTAQLDTITKKFNTLVPRSIIGIYFICVYY
jgi:hypothetical protein